MLRQFHFRIGALIILRLSEHPMPSGWPTSLIAINRLNIFDMVKRMLLRIQRTFALQVPSAYAY